jgi:hypothetical protein
MFKHLCGGLVAAACMASATAADAADLSMTPIYKSRPSTAAAPNGSLKAEYRPIHALDTSRLDPPAAGGAFASTAAKPQALLPDRVPWWR